MLIRFRVENFRSIQHEQELSLVASSISDEPHSVVLPANYEFGILPVAAVYGANASGKSTIVHALRFMQSAVTDSHRTWKPDGGIPREPFAFSSTSRDAPSTFVADLLLEGVRYEYGFVVDSSRVLEEWLYAYPRGRRQEWFSRDATREEPFEFSRLFPGENRTIAALTRTNSLFLSAAAQNNHDLLSPISAWFSRQVAVLDAITYWAASMKIGQRCTDPEYRAAVFSLMRAADVGISGIELETQEESDAPKNAFKSFITALSGFGPAGIRLLHRNHAGGETGIPFDGESAGTRTLFVLAGLIVDVMKHGGTLVVDELDRSLHPQLALKIVSLFQNSATNPNHAQLIFNTHDTNLLDAGLLRRDQVWFTEKGDDGATRLFPLTDFRARKNENLERGYLQGRYGAVPSLRTPDVLLRTAS